MFSGRCRPGRNCMNFCVIKFLLRDNGVRPKTAVRNISILYACLLAAVFSLVPVSLAAPATTAKQRSLNEWRGLTALATNGPRAFVRGDRIRFYFQVGTNFFEFTGNWSRHRIPAAGYRVDSALLHWKQRITKIPDGGRS